jgi:ribosome-binding protein aMBF1 (putative translation factor)
MTTKRKFAKVEKFSDDVLDDLLEQITPDEQEATDYKMRLAAKIDKALETKGWNGLQFAKAMDKKPSEISKWLSGKHNFTVDTLRVIEKKLGITLLNLEDENKVEGYLSLGMYHAALSAGTSTGQENAITAFLNQREAGSKTRKFLAELIHKKIQGQSNK